MMPPPNPALQALLDSLPHTHIPFELITAPVPGANPPQTSMLVVSPVNKQVVCEETGTDFSAINYMHQFLKGAPPEAIPPPPNVQPPPQRAEMVKMAKEQGNVCPTRVSYLEVSSG